MPSRDPQLVVDGFGALDAGTNSGTAPQLLERNQTSFSTNATYRGGFLRNRPGFKLVPLNFGGDLALQQRFERGLWQGAAFFRSEYGEEGDVVSISGRIYFLVDKGATREVRDVTPLTGGPDDPNSSGNVIAWLWQSERWMIINDGQKLPIFFDGQISRRSRGPSQVVGTLANPFNAPAIGAQIAVTLTAPYTGPVNENVFIGSAFYQVNSSAVGYKVTLRNRTEPAGGTIPALTLIQIQSNLAGLLATPSNPLCSNFGGGGGISQCNYTLNITPPQNGTISGTTPLVSVRTSGTNYVFGSGVGTNKIKVFGYSSPFPANSAVYIGSPAVTGLAGVVQQDFVIPAIGGTVDVTIQNPYNGAVPQTVAINGGIYDIIAVNNNPVPSNVINITNVNDTPATLHGAGTTLNTIPELGTGKMGAYGRGRNWYSLPDGRSFRASDIVGGSSGSPAFASRDAVLKETENTYLFGGGDFVVPGNIGDIRAIWFTAILDTSLGQGPLMIGTSKSIFSCQAPVDRTTWQTVTNPILTEALIGKGPLGQYGTILVNSDTIFRAIDGLASLILARRDFDKWGNVPISREVQRVIDEDKDSLLQNATAMQFDNRLLMGCLPVQGPLGVYHQGMIVINFDPVSSLRGKADSIYDGFWTGINTLQFVTGTYAGTDRAFAYTFNSFFQRIELFELLPSAKENNFDNQGIPITCSFESASLFKDVKGKGLFDEVELLDGEIYLADMRGIVNVQAWHRPDYAQCWTPWINFDVCADNQQSDRPKQFRTRLGLGQPSAKYCEPTNNKPYRIGCTHQVRFEITGAFTFKGCLIKGKLGSETQWAIPVCDDLCAASIETVEPCEPCKDQGTCLEFPLLYYSLSDHKSYTNPLLSFEITCPDDSVQTVYVPAGTINYTLPFPPEFAGPYPPLVLGCVSGGNVVRAVPDNATQGQIDVIVDEMINICARAYAESIVVCAGQVFTNEQVFFQMTCAEDTTITYSGTLPSWLSLNTETNQVIGQAGVINGASTEEATATAQAQLDAWAEAAITAATLTCESDTPPIPTIVFVDTDTTGWVAGDNVYGFAQNGSTFYGLGRLFFYSSTDGVNWTNLGAHNLSTFLRGNMAFGNGLFVTTDEDGIHTSIDGITWSAPIAGSSAIMWVVYAGGKFVGVGNGNTAFTSPDGVVWTLHGATGFGSTTCVAYGLGLYIATGSNQKIFSSPDGITWTERHTGAANTMQSVAFTNGIFVAVGNNFTALFSSIDGITWTAQTLPALPFVSSLSRVGGGNGLFVISGSLGEMFTSTDGANWTFLVDTTRANAIVHFTTANTLNVGMNI